MEPTIRIEHKLLAVEQEHRIAAMLELHAPPAPEGEARPPLCLSLVVDESGSMGGAKIAAARTSARYLAERLSGTDEVALVGFDTDVRLHAPLQPARVDALVPLIERLRSRATTNLSGGWLKGVEEQRRRPDARSRKVVLLSDGLANVGITDRGALADLAASAARDGIVTTTIGFGEGFDEELMTAMATAAGGRAYFAATADDAASIFAEEFEGLVSIVAQNLSVEIRPSDEVKLLGVLNDFPATEVAGGLQLQLGDVIGSQLRRVVFELHIPHLAELGVRRVADIVIRYVVVDGTPAMYETTIPVTVNLVDADTAAAEAADTQVVEEVAILRAAHDRKSARRMADEGDYEGAASLLMANAARLRAMAPASEAPDELLQDAEELEYTSEHLARRQWSALDKKRVHYEAYRRARSDKQQIIEEWRRRRGDD